MTDTKWKRDKHAIWRRATRRIPDRRVAVCARVYYRAGRWHWRVYTLPCPVVPWSEEYRRARGVEDTREAAMDSAEAAFQAECSRSCAEVTP